MKFYLLIIIYISINCLPTNVVGQSILVNDTYTADQLVKDILVNSPCAVVSNIIVKGDNLSGSKKSYGYFSAGTSSFPFANGVVLSTCSATRTAGPNDNLIDEGSTSWLGDSDLETAVNFTGTFNATVLEFDFTPFTSKISFDYLFASEEYQGTAPCRYSDAFAFLLKPLGSTTPYLNLAIIPNTNLPILVTSVHPEITGNNGCPAQNEAFFDTYNNISAPINLNGQTKIFTAKADVIPGTIYHIKLVISDHENVRYDSAIFLAGGSFKIGTNLGDDKLLSNNKAACTGEQIVLNATQINATYKWFKNNVQIFDVISGLAITTPTYNVTSGGTYKVEVILNGSCPTSDEIVIEYAQKPILNNVSLKQCDDNGDGKTTFDLSQLDDAIKNNIANSPLLNATNAVKYYKDINATDLIITPNTYVNTTLFSETIFAKVINSFGCSAIATVNLSISNNVIADQNFTFCDTDLIQDGKTEINYYAQLTPKLLSPQLFPAGLTVNFYNSNEDAILQKNLISNLSAVATSNQQIVYGRIISNSDCFGIIKITLKISTFNAQLLKDETKYICPNNIIKLEVDTGYSYLWGNGLGTSNFVNVTSDGIYTVKITNAENCDITKKFIVKKSDSAVITNIIVSDFNENNNTILINYEGIGNYEFSLDGINFQDNPLFSNVSFGEYFVTVRDKYKCSDTVSDTIYVLDYPKFFTPNNDGLNDIWFIKNLTRSAKISIYDRFGKLLKQFNNNSEGWNGTFNQDLLPSDDYWFTIVFDDNQIIKNHFALKR